MLVFIFVAGDVDLVLFPRLSRIRVPGGDEFQGRLMRNRGRPPLNAFNTPLVCLPQRIVVR